MSSAFIPTSAPVSSPLKLRFQIKHTPAGASSKLNGPSAGSSKIIPASSVITHCVFSPSAPSSVAVIRSAPPSPMQTVVSSVVEISPPATPFLVTEIALDSSKHPSKSSAFIPTSAPEISPSKLKCQIRQTPAPAPSRSNGPPTGRSRMFPASSVITHALLSPTFPSKVTLIGSATPSPAQISVGSSVEMVPPITSHPPKFSSPNVEA